MSESLPILVDTADRLFGDLGGQPAAPFEALWPQVEASGIGALLLPEDKGGFGGDWQDAFAVIRLAGVHALALPVAEAILTGALGWDGGEGYAAIAPACEGVLADGRFSGRASGVPWGRQARAVFAMVDGGLLRIDAAGAATTQRDNPAGEPRDLMVFDGAAAETADGPDGFALGAIARVAQIAGALDAALDLSIEHANGRSQFGKPIAKFQAVQQSLAVFAEEAAAVNCAGQAAARAADLGDAAFEIAAAKLRANRACGVGAAVAHQIHGAIGFTHESSLHRLTRRLAGWRTEFGGDRFWSERLGRRVAARGADAFWPDIVARGETA
jgi:acyl-CoA dehydrogenase